MYKFPVWKQAGRLLYCNRNHRIAACYYNPPVWNMGFTVHRFLVNGFNRLQLH